MKYAYSLRSILKSIVILGLFLGLCPAATAQGAPNSEPGKDKAVQASPKPAPKGATVVPEPDAQQIAERVQAFYDRTKTFQAAFDQTFTIKATQIEKKSSGQVVFQKPGRMSWRYKNNGNRVVSDGKTIRVYERENRQMFESDMGKSSYPAALSFLVGEGKLSSSFQLKKLEASKMKFEGGWVLEAKPNEATPAYQTMILYVDAATAQVRRVLLLDAQGNRNRFDFSAPKANAKTDAGEFTFVPPEGTQVVRQ
jgi:outer membrane lipoprotein carrier protein